MYHERKATFRSRQSWPNQTHTLLLAVLEGNPEHAMRDTLAPTAFGKPSAPQEANTFTTLACRLSKVSKPTLIPCYKYMSSRMTERHQLPLRYSKVMILGKRLAFDCWCPQSIPSAQMDLLPTILRLQNRVHEQAIRRELRASPSRRVSTGTSINSQSASKLTSKHYKSKLQTMSLPKDPDTGAWLGNPSQRP